MKTLSEVKEVFARHEVYDNAKKRPFMPKCQMSQALWDLDINPIFTDLEVAMAEADSDGDGKIDLEEFKTFYLMMYREYATNPQRALSLFMQIDTDSNGWLSREELYKVTADGQPDKLSDDEFDEFWKSMDLDGNNEICAAEFVVSICPDTPADELNALLLAYGLDPNAEHYCKIMTATDAKKGKKLLKRRSERSLTEAKKKQQQKQVVTAEYNERERDIIAEQETAFAALKEKELKGRDDAEVKRKNREERDEKRMAQLEDDKKKQEEQRKLDEEKAKREEPKKEGGGCCAVS